MISPTEQALKFAPWSISKYQTAEQCASKFEHQYILKSPKMISSWESRVGSALHGITEFRLNGMDLAPAYAKAIAEHSVSPEEEYRVKSLIPAVDRFLVKWESFLREKQIKNVLYECELAIDAHGKSVKYWDKKAFLRGKLDVLAYSDDGVAYIVDHKSGKVTQIRYMDKHNPQLHSYFVMADAKHGPFRGIWSGIHFLQADDSSCIQWLPKRAVSPASCLEQYMNELIGAINEAADGLESPYLATPSNLCDYCDYRNICSKYAKRPPEESDDLMEYALSKIRAG